MIETEVKFRLPRAEFLKRLEIAENKFGNSSASTQYDILFDNPKLKLRRNGKVLRLRTEGSKHYLTWKGKQLGKKQKYKIKEEIEIEVSEYKKVLAILKKLGFVKSMVIKKQRQLFLMNKCKVCFDEVAILGNFIEIEGNKASIENMIKILNLQGEQRITKGYAQLMGSLRDM